MTRAAIGVDVGGTAVKAGVLLDGRVEAVLDVPTPSREGPEALIRLLAGAIEKLESGLPQEIIPCPLGIGCAGLVDTARGIVLTSPNLPAWKNAPLSELSETFLLRRAIILNDANAVALAESRHGAGVGSDHVIVITLGTGVGGGIVLNGRMWTGRHGFAGEIGHMPLVADGPVCACGSRGCVEAMIGTVAIVRFRSPVSPNAGATAQL